MSNTSLSDTYSNLCRDYSSFIKWAIGKISKNTTKWTDYTVSEPDTLMLSSISTMHDYAQYIIDQTYLNTDIDVCTTRFLHQVSAAMGQYLSGTNSIKIPIRIENNSQENITILAYELFTYESELFTNPNTIIIPSNSIAESYIVRNSVNEMIYKINKSSNGEFFLHGPVETCSISVYGIKENGEQVKLNLCDYIFDLLYDYEDASNNKYKFLISSIDNEILRIKISPIVLTTFTAILVKYTTIDDYPIKENLQLNLVSNLDLKITTTSNVSINSDIPINEEKLIYLNSLTKIRTLCNKPYSLDLGELNRRIDKYQLQYEPSVDRDILPFFEYTTYDGKPLNGDPDPRLTSKTDYFKTILLSPDNELMIIFDTIPVYDVTITYNYNITITIPNSTLLELIDPSNKSIQVTLQDYKNTHSIFVGFKNLGNFVEYDSLKNIKYLETEMSILINKFYKNILIMHKIPVIKFLSSYILSLESTITLSRNVNYLEVMTKITILLDNLLINDKIVSRVRGSYRRLELLIQNNIKEVSEIKFVKDEYIVRSDAHLVIDSPENYINSGSIIFKNREDE